MRPQSILLHIAVAGINRKSPIPRPHRPRPNQKAKNRAAVQVEVVARDTTAQVVLLVLKDITAQQNQQFQRHHHRDTIIHRRTIHRPTIRRHTIHRRTIHRPIIHRPIIHRHIIHRHRPPTIM